jgi:CheY-like chemotaxis protein
MLQGRTRDTGAGGAKILLKERLPVGTQVALQFRPPGQAPVGTRALVWRIDADGLACLFVGTPEPRFLAVVAAPTPPASPSRAGQGEGTGTILVASGDPAIRSLAVAALERAGYTVLDAGPQPLLALRFAEERPDSIDLFLVDVEIRLMSGAPLAERLASLRPSTKLMLISGGASKTPTTPRAISLTTPFTPEDLAARVRQALDADPGAAAPAG